jgi:hypothetical protein
VVQRHVKNFKHPVMARFKRATHDRQRWTARLKQAVTVAILNMM